MYLNLHIIMARNNNLQQYHYDFRHNWTYLSDLQIFWWEYQTRPTYNHTQKQDIYMEQWDTWLITDYS